MYCMFIIYLVYAHPDPWLIGWGLPRVSRTAPMNWWSSTMTLQTSRPCMMLTRSCRRRRLSFMVNNYGLCGKDVGIIETKNLLEHSCISFSIPRLRNTAKLKQIFRNVESEWGSHIVVTLRCWNVSCVFWIIKRCLPATDCNKGSPYLSISQLRCSKAVMEQNKLKKRLDFSATYIIHPYIPQIAPTSIPTEKVLIDICMNLHSRGSPGFGAT